MDRLFDTHAHYSDGKFAASGIDVDALLPSLFSDGLAGIVNVGTNPDTSEQAVEMAKRYPAMFASVGLHPEDHCQRGTLASDLERLEKMLRSAEENKIVAIGEIGLDYYWDRDHVAEQKECLDIQLSLAEQYQLPVIIHDREAHGDCMEAVFRHPGVRGVFHSFSGSPEMARELFRRGWYISFSGVVTFPNAKKAREAARTVPDEFLLIETDCPYLSPVPHRGECNHSGYMQHTLEVLAELRKTGREALAERLCRNAGELFSGITL